MLVNVIIFSKMTRESIYVCAVIVLQTTLSCSLEPADYNELITKLPSIYTLLKLLIAAASLSLAEINSFNNVRREFILG